MSIANTIDAQKILDNSKELDWYHKFEIEQGSGVITPGRLDTQGYKWRRDFLGLTPEYLKGKRVLDIGAYSGAFTFLLQDLGAEVVAVDVYNPELNGFNLVRNLRGQDVEHHVMSIYDLDPEIIGTFDIVACYGVYYHLRHPLLAFERCNSVCKDGGLFVGGGTGMDNWFHNNDDSCLKGVNFQKLTREFVNDEKIISVDTLNDMSVCGFVPDQFLKDKSNWFIPNLSSLVSWVNSSGFEVLKSHKNTMVLDRDWNEDNKVSRTSLNFVAKKTGEPTLEYTYERMKQFRIPTQLEVDKLKNKVEMLERQLEEMYPLKNDASQK